MSLLHTVSDHTREDTQTPNPDSSSPRVGRGRVEPPGPPEQPSGGQGGSLTRVTANFTPRAINALDNIAAKTGDSKTDILNRSVMVFEVFLELVERGNGTLTVVHPDGRQETLRFLG